MTMQHKEMVFLSQGEVQDLHRLSLAFEGTDSFSPIPEELGDLLEKLSKRSAGKQQFVVEIPEHTCNREGDLRDKTKQNNKKPN